jgi:hypothetical protein
MKKLLLAMIMMISSSAHAEWKLIDFNDEAAFYLEDFFATGGSPLIWQLIDYKNPNKFGNLSAKILWEMDCGKRVMRRLMFSSHPHRMGIGEATVMDKEATEWEKPALDSTQESIFIIACRIDRNDGPKI